MKIRRNRSRLAIVAAVGVAGLTLAGCTTTGDEEPEAVSGGTITVAEVNEITSLNGDTSHANLDINGKVGYLTSSGFNYLSDELELIPNETFGEVVLESEDPLVVTYTINEGQTWSDGEPITANDLLLNWAVQSGYYDDASYDDAGELTGGNAYFEYAGDTTGLGLTEFPTISDDGLSLTLEYSEPFADWSYVSLLGKPMHIVAEKAGFTVDEVVEAFETTPRGDANAPAEPNEVIRAVADFWNTGYDITEMPEDEDLLVASGAFLLSDWTPTQSITLVKNENYTGGYEVAYDELVIRFIGDATEQVTALENGEVDIIAPQASADTLSALEAIETATVLTGDQFAYDHIDLTFNEGPFMDQNVREAFLKTVPRQQIFDGIIAPLNPEGSVLNSQIFVPTNGDVYDEAVSVNGSDAYAEVDIEGAREMLAGATPTVRILYNSDNPNRVDAFQLIKASAEQAGFVVEDLGTPEWSSLLGAGGYDASIFGWVSSGVGVTGVPQLFATNGGGNYSYYSNPEVDALAEELVKTVDLEEQQQLQIEIDTHLFADAYGLPLFQSAGVTAHSNVVEGVTHFPGQTGVYWNFWEWTVTG